MVFFYRITNLSGLTMKWEWNDIRRGFRYTQESKIYQKYKIYTFYNNKFIIAFVG